MSLQDAKDQLRAAMRHGLDASDGEHARAVIQALAESAAPEDLEEQREIEDILWDTFEEWLAEGVELDPVPTLLYHGTTPMGYASIRREGFRPTDEGIFFGSNPKMSARYAHTHHGYKLPGLESAMYSHPEDPSFEVPGEDIDPGCLYVLEVETKGLDPTRFDRWPINDGYHQGHIYNYPDPIPADAIVSVQKFPLFVIHRPASGDM